MRWFAFVLVVLVVLLQYKAWFSDVGHFAVQRMQAEVSEQQQRTERYEARNAVLRAEVIALKDGLDAVEARARHELGLVRQDEVFYVVTPNN